MNTKILYALDFDGVICDSAVENAITGWKAAHYFWPDMEGQSISDHHIQQFRSIRPCLEFGYEAVLIMRLLQQNVLMSPLCEGYHQQLQTLIDLDDLDKDILQKVFGQTRDNEIESNESAWITNNPLFAGATDKLKLLKQEDWFVITTKQERFVKRILKANDIQLDDHRIFGLDRKLNKQAVLSTLKTDYPESDITFVEDRLPTLIGVMENQDLQDIKLQLVDWGYNTESTRKQALDKGIEVIAMDRFLQ